jgi:hypothetical protein
MLRRSGVVVAAVVLVISLTASSASALTPVDVLATSAWEGNPAASMDYLAWDEFDGRHSIVWVRATGGEPVKVNADETDGWAGGISGTTLVYSQRRYGHPRALDVFVYDLIANTRSKIGSPVNTKRQQEGVGSLSGDWLLFERWYRNNATTIFLYNLATHELRKVHSTFERSRWLISQQVSGNFAVFTRTIDHYHGPCDVFRYDIDTGTTTKIPNPKSKCQYAPSVDLTGTVYFVRSGFGCARDVTIRQFPLSGPVTTLLGLADNLDLYQTYAVDNGDGTTDVYFDPNDCNSVPDIQRITVPQ